MNKRLFLLFFSIFSGVFSGHMEQELQNQAQCLEQSAESLKNNRICCDKDNINEYVSTELIESNNSKAVETYKDAVIYSFIKFWTLNSDITNSKASLRKFLLILILLETKLESPCLQKTMYRRYATFNPQNFLNLDGQRRFRQFITDYDHQQRLFKTYFRDEFIPLQDIAPNMKDVKNVTKFMSNMLNIHKTSDLALVHGAISMVPMLFACDKTFELINKALMSENYKKVHSQVVSQINDIKRYNRIFRDSSSTPEYEFIFSDSSCYFSATKVLRTIVNKDVNFYPYENLCLYKSLEHILRSYAFMFNFLADLAATPSDKRHFLRSELFETIRISAFYENVMQDPGFRNICITEVHDLKTVENGNEVASCFFMQLLKDKIKNSNFSEHLKAKIKDMIPRWLPYTVKKAKNSQLPIKVEDLEA